MPRPYTPQTPLHPMPRTVEEIAHDLLKNAERAHELNLELQEVLSDATTGWPDCDVVPGIVDAGKKYMESAFRSPLQGAVQFYPTRKYRDDDGHCYREDMMMIDRSPL